MLITVQDFKGFWYFNICLFTIREYIPVWTEAQVLTSMYFLSVSFIVSTVNQLISKKQFIFETISSRKIRWISSRMCVNQIIPYWTFEIVKLNPHKIGKKCLNAKQSISENKLIHSIWYFISLSIIKKKISF